MVHCPRFLYDSSAVGSCSLTCRSPNIEATVWPQAILHWCVCVCDWELPTITMLPGLCMAAIGLRIRVLRQCMDAKNKVSKDMRFSQVKESWQDWWASV